MAQLSSLIPLVRERCSGVIDQFALDHLKRAYQKFCVESLFLARSHQFDQGDFTVGEAAALSIDEHHTMGGVSFVLNANGHEIERGIDYNATANGDVFLTCSTPAFRVFYYVTPLFSLPDEFEADDVIVSKWADYLADGAASSLMKMPNTEWTDFNLSSHYQSKFIEGYRLAYRVAVNTLDDQRPTKPREYY